MKHLLYLIFPFISLMYQPIGIEPYKGNFDINIISFNLRYDEPRDGENQWKNRKEACVSMLKEFQPSVFGIQEGLHNQVSYLDEKLPNYDYVGVGRDDGRSKGEYAAIFYDVNHFELLGNGNFWLSETPEKPSKGWDANNIRITTWVKLKDIKKDKIIYVFNAHFDHIGEVAQLKSSELLVQKIQEITEPNTPVFITGDFNMLMESDRLEPITSQYLSAKKSVEISDDYKSFNGFGSKVPGINIDFIFYKNAKALAYKTIIKDYGVSYISDHYPIVSYFAY